ncbi:hypothetical protein CONCODRAFT_12913 [Conidiobolus coronatus NRRL 28638]|uniref:Uncharacterized protein n=1 Tax=Conidiobolus coronatus (strain ATCC 28846 / CBS 209.66 / NRRL 28638) TaxID=796925 RepID=A0A137NRW2_CONC2|nr:hypothetical protein CONCODRAFT_12913 [Conidiobolus coronatus NRRL 28638]|eukprot:KXN65487.1 hypothetical protein CONCODRAFT_12913 [Conidiobolus coronatus NRRL 28638]
MFEKYNFVNYLILATILSYALGLTLDIWKWNRDHGLSAFIFELQVAALGAYSLFIENEFLNTNSYYQVFIIALITGYQSITNIEHAINWGSNIYVHYLNVAWAFLALAIYYKLPNFLVYIFRYDIGFTIFTAVIRYAPVRFYYSDVIAAVLSIGFIFISYLTFARIANYSSTFLFSHMLVTGLITIINEIPYIFRIRHNSTITVSLVLVTFLVAIYYRHKKNNTQGTLLGSDVPSYNAIGSQA